MTSSSKLIDALNQIGVQVVFVQKNKVFLEMDYLVEIETEKLYKLSQGGLVIGPFDKLEELCDFIIKDIQLNEEN